MGGELQTARTPMDLPMQLCFKQEMFLIQKTKNFLNGIKVLSLLQHV